MNPGVRESGSAESGSPGNAASGSLEVRETGTPGVRSVRSPGVWESGIRESGSGVRELRIRKRESRSRGGVWESESLGVRSLEVRESGILGIQEFEESGVRESGGPESGSLGV